MRVKRYPQYTAELRLDEAGVPYWVEYPACLDPVKAGVIGNLSAASDPVIGAGHAGSEEEARALALRDARERGYEIEE